MRLLLMATDERLLPHSVHRLRRRWGASVEIVSLIPSPTSAEPEVLERWRALRRRLDAVAREHLAPLFACGDSTVLEGACDLWYQFHVGPLFRQLHAVRQAVERERPDRLVVADGWPGANWWLGRDHDLAAAGRQVAQEAGLPCEGGHDRGAWAWLRDRLALGMVGVRAWRRAARRLVGWVRGRRVANEFAPTKAHGVGNEFPPTKAGALVLFVGYYPSQTQVSRALATTLPGGLEQTVLLDRTGACQGQPWPHVLSPSRYLSWSRAWRAWWSLVGATGRNPVGATGRSPLQTVCDEFGLPLAPLLPRLWRTRLDALADGLDLAWIAEPLLEELQPAAVIITHGRRPGLSALFQAARARRIPTVYHMHGLWNAQTLERHASLQVDQALVFGSYYAEAFAAEGMPPERIQVIGRWGAPTPQPPPDTGGGAEGGGRSTILCLTQTGVGRGQGPGDTWVGTVLAAAAQIPNAHVLVKLHPQEDQEDRARYRRALEITGASGELVEHATATVADLLARARVLVTQFSTAAFEALAAGIPVVTVNLSPEPDVYPFAAEGAALGVYQAEEMLPQLQRALSHQPTRERLRETGRQFYARHMGPAEPVRPEWERIIANAEVGMQNAE